MNGNYPVASFLLRKGTDANVKDSSGNTPAHYAAAYGWYHCLKLLFQAGADPNQPNDWKVRLLYQEKCMCWDVSLWTAVWFQAFFV